MTKVLLVCRTSCGRIDAPARAQGLRLAPIPAKPGA
jgi:hypothetical protein